VIVWEDVLDFFPISFSSRYCLLLALLHVSLFKEGAIPAASKLFSFKGACSSFVDQKQLEREELTVSLNCQ